MPMYRWSPRSLINAGSDHREDALACEAVAAHAVAVGVEPAEAVDDDEIPGGHGGLRLPARQIQHADARGSSQRVSRNSPLSSAKSVLRFERRSLTMAFISFRRLW
jgi:hypothetical protein